jgi:hypothetical protein
VARWGRLRHILWQGFPVCVSLVACHAPFPPPAHRTGRAEWINDAKSDQERAEREASDFLRYHNSRDEYADFHGLRHTYITTVCQTVASQTMAQSLARHSDPRLTARYTHLELHDRAAAASQLPPPYRKAAVKMNAAF